eukprot:403358226
MEAFKVDSLLHMFNNCADKCQLQYKESGIRGGKNGQVAEDVQCFNNCITKSYSVSQIIFQ